MSNFVTEKRINILKKGMKIKNPHNYDYIINPEYSVCHKNNILLVFTVITRVDSFDRRQLIRSLWSNHTLKSNYEFVFMVGKSSNQTINEMVKNEFDIYEDIVQENFIDSYWNLTLKSIMSYKWVSKYCRNSVYVVKIDDDVIVDFRKFISYLKKYFDENVLDSNVICLAITNSGPARYNLTKFYVSVQEYPFSKYPTHCAGPAYIYTIRLAEKLYLISEYIKYFKIEDINLGFLTSKLNFLNVTSVKFTSIRSYYNDIRNISLIYSDDYFNNPNVSYFFHFHIDCKLYNFVYNKVNLT